MNTYVLIDKKENKIIDKIGYIKANNVMEVMKKYNLFTKEKINIGIIQI